MKSADQIALFFKENKIKHVFGIIGAGNAQIFDSIFRLGYTEIICVHHEQAAVMAAQTYYRISGIVTAALVTTGGGSSNAVTGVVGAWMDSIPVLIIAGNENSKYTTNENKLRIWGVQGYDTIGMMRGVTKYCSRINDPEDVLLKIEEAYSIAQMGRFGPAWIEIPMNIQSAKVSESKRINKVIPLNRIPTKNNKFFNPNNGAVAILENLKKAKRPLIWLGHGIRLSKSVDLIEPLVDKLKCPVLTSWSGADLISSDHTFYYGRAGVYGQRSANFILQNCDFLLTLGTRLSIPQIGYDINEFAREAQIACVDIDPVELMKHQNRINYPILSDVGDFIKILLKKLENQRELEIQEWLRQCSHYKKAFPIIGPEHDDKDGFINSYRFIQKLEKHLSEREIIVTDMGTALLCTHQVLKLKKQQRLMTSQGLGEMGFGLPGAIGACIANNKQQVLCLNCDGGMMMNFQELQTIVHHQLPIKIIIFNNDGYLMIKHTQSALFEKRLIGTDAKTGVSCPNFSKIAKAFEIPAFSIKTWEDFELVMPQVQTINRPVICEVFMAPNQTFLPKLSIIPQEDGSIISPPLEDLSPLLPKDKLLSNMLVDVHEKSLKLR